VEVSRTVDNPNNVYNYNIESTATVRNRKRKMQARLIVDQTSGQVNLTSIVEVSVQ